MTEYRIVGKFNKANAVAESVSCNIGIINQESLYSLTKNAFNGVIPDELKRVSINRLRGDFRKKDAVWGIKESTKSSYSRISNLVCLSGDLLSFYIEPEGHGVGAFDGEVVFAKSSLEIRLYDVLRGESKDILFTDFTSPKNDPGRFLVLKIPDENDTLCNQFFSENGMYGLMVMRIREKTEFHKRADWTDSMNYPQTSLPRYNDHFVQILIYPWNLALREFDFSSAQQNFSVSNLSRFVTGAIDESDQTVDIFDNSTYFPSYRSISKGVPIDLRNDEKDQIIRQNTLALISSQLPLLNASAFLSPVLGIGMAESFLSKTEIHPVSRPRAWENLYSKSKSATTFSLTGIPPLVNTLSGLNDFSKNNNQLSLVARNPVRVISKEEDPNLTKLSFALLGQSTSGFFAISNAENAETSIVLNGEKNKEVNVHIEISQFTNPERSSYSSSGTSFSNSSSYSSQSSSTMISGSSLSSSIAHDSIVISFDTEIPDDKIKSVSFSFSINDFDFKTYIDQTGMSREKIFYYDDYLINITVTDIIYGRVGIEDENGIVTYWYAEYNLPIGNKKFSITDLKTKVRRDGSGLVDIYYNLEAPFEIAVASVKIQKSLNNGASWESIDSNIYGDFGDNIKIGQTRHIVWNPWMENPLYAGVGLSVKIVASNEFGLLAIGRNRSGVFHIERPRQAYISKYTTGIRQGIYDGTSVKDPFVNLVVKETVIETSSSCSSISSESSCSSSSESSVSSSISSQTSFSTLTTLSS